MTNEELITPYFKPSEFTCDGKVVLENMDAKFLAKLVTLRERCGFPFTLNSSYRTPAKNKRVGGATDSMHLQGRAVDIAVSGAISRWELIRHATSMGLSVGIMENAIHIDDRAQPVAFHYYSNYTRK